VIARDILDPGEVHRHTEFHAHSGQYRLSASEFWFPAAGPGTAPAQRTVPSETRVFAGMLAARLAGRTIATSVLPVAALCRGN